jgi:regulator of RNase E activity RraA
MVADFRCRIEIEGVVVENGGLIFGDVDGVVVIPRELEEEVIRKALEKAAAGSWSGWRSKTACLPPPRLQNMKSSIVLSH